MSRPEEEFGETPGGPGGDAERSGRRESQMIRKRRRVGDEEGEGDTSSRRSSRDMNINK